jgi:hypothetical protein
MNISSIFAWSAQEGSDFFSHCCFARLRCESNVPAALKEGFLFIPHMDQVAAGHASYA